MGYIAPADTGNLRHLPLALRRLSFQSEPQCQDPVFLSGQAPGHDLPEPGCDLCLTQRFQHIVILADHIHQRQLRSLIPGIDIVGKRDILAAFPLAAEVH